MLGRRLFYSGLILTAGFALAHLGGFIQAAYAARNDPSMADLTRAMLGFHPSILDFREYFSLNFSVLLLLGAALGFAAMTITSGEQATIRTMSIVYVVAMLLLLGTSVFYSIVQGIITCSALALLFMGSWWLAS